MTDAPRSLDLFTVRTDQLPARVDEFRQWMVAAIPCFPDTAAVRAELAAFPLATLIITYLNWARRLVPARPRSLTFAPSFWKGLTCEQENAVHDLADNIRRGEDLTPYLSDRAEKEGYAPKRAARKGPDWAAKDFALNSWGVHHVHLKPSGSRELLYALFSRESALALMLGDHKSFDDGSLERSVAEARAASGQFVLKDVTPFEYPDIDRTKLARRGVNTISAAGDQAVMGVFLASDGSSVWNGQFMRKIVHTLQQYELNLDKPGWLRSITNPPTELVGPRYRFVGTDLCIVSIEEGPVVLLEQGFC